MNLSNILICCVCVSLFARGSRQATSISRFLTAHSDPTPPPTTKSILSVFQSKSGCTKFGDLGGGAFSPVSWEMFKLKKEAIFNSSGGLGGGV